MARFEKSEISKKNWKPGESRHNIENIWCQWRKDFKVAPGTCQPKKKCDVDRYKGAPRQIFSWSWIQPNSSGRTHQRGMQQYSLWKIGGRHKSSTKKHQVEILGKWGQNRRSLSSPNAKRATGSLKKGKSYVWILVYSLLYSLFTSVFTVSSYDPILFKALCSSPFSVRWALDQTNSQQLAGELTKHRCYE